MRLADYTPAERSYYDDGWLAAHQGGLHVGDMLGTLPEPYMRGFADRFSWALSDPATSTRAYYPHMEVRISIEQQVLAYLRGGPRPAWATA